jgi:hypothetical protein
VEPEEILIGDEWVIRLDDNVVELMHKTGKSHRFHVKHVAVEAKPGDDGALKLRVGVETDGQIVEGTTVDVPAEQQGEVTELFGEARNRREELQRGAD